MVKFNWKGTGSIKMRIRQHDHFYANEPFITKTSETRLEPWMPMLMLLARAFSFSRETQSFGNVAFLEFHRQQQKYDTFRSGRIISIRIPLKTCNYWNNDEPFPFNVSVEIFASAAASTWQLDSETNRVSTETKEKRSRISLSPHFFFSIRPIVKEIAAGQNNRKFPFTLTFLFISVRQP